MALGLDAAFGIHASALELRERRATVIAANLANADTPGYRARDIDFEAALADARTASSDALRRTDPRHLGGAGIRAGFVRYRNPDQPSLDDNTVNVHREQAAFMDNAIRYQASLTFLGSRIQSLQLALRGE